MKKIHIIGGGTFSYVRAHLALCTPAFGTTAIRLADIFNSNLKSEDAGEMEVILTLTKMADSSSSIVTNKDVSEFVDSIVEDFDTQIVIFNVALCDFYGQIGDIESGKHATRLKSREANGSIELTPTDKLIKRIRAERKDIFLVGFKTTCNATEQEQYLAGLNLLKNNSCNLVLSNDIGTRTNMIITPEEARYCVTSDREEALHELVEMSLLRSHLTFTRSTVVEAEPVSWESELVPKNLRTVVDHCITNNAYKPFNGATVGHFATKIGDNTFLTSRRKVNFNKLNEVGLVKIETDGPDTVIAYGSKPSVGGQSQRIIFNEHEGYNHIVHFHCPLKDNPRDAVPVVSQREYECGSHECGQNTSNGLQEFGNLKAVMLDNHGPNIVFKNSTSPQEVIDFIEANFDLTNKTGGLVD